MRRGAVVFLVAMAVFAASCGDDGGAEGDATPTSTTTTTTTEPPATTSTSSTTTTTTTTSTTTTSTTTTTPPVEDGPLIANPERPWVAEHRDAFVARSGMNIEAANCVFETMEREGLDSRLLVWSDTSTPPQIPTLIGLCGTELSGGYDLPPVTYIDAQEYGDDATLDQLWDWCEAGDDGSCDSLWWQSNSDSAYEAFAADCGGRGGSDGECARASGQRAYGDSTLFDVWYDSCTDGYGLSCNSLDFDAPEGSAYQAYGRSCGDRFPADPDNNCEELLAPEE